MKLLHVSFPNHDIICTVEVSGRASSVSPKPKATSRPEKRQCRLWKLFQNE